MPESPKPDLAAITARIIKALDAFDAGAIDEPVDDPDPADRAAVIERVLRESGLAD